METPPQDFPPEDAQSNVKLPPVSEPQVIHEPKILKPSSLQLWYNAISNFSFREFIKHPNPKALKVGAGVIIFMILSSLLYFIRVKSIPEVPAQLPQQQFILTPTPEPTLDPGATVSASVSPVPTSTITPTPIRGLTYNWPAFVSSKYKYTVRYPPDWQIQVVKQSDPKVLEYVVFNPKTSATSVISISISYSSRTYAEAVAMDTQPGTQITVASASAVRRLQQNSDGLKKINVVVSAGSGTQSVIINAKEQYADVLNNMLPTFRFL